jgi:hypothetical protein
LKTASYILAVQRGDRDHDLDFNPAAGGTSPSVQVGQGDLIGPAPATWPEIKAA